jgi:hypothetical protein
MGSERGHDRRVSHERFPGAGRYTVLLGERMGAVVGTGPTLEAALIEALTKAGA